MKILCRADGNSEMGLGHLYRMMAIVDFCNEEYQFYFVTRSTSLLSVLPKNYPIIVIPSNISYEHEPVWFSSNYTALNFIVILDGYNFNSAYQKKIKNEGFKSILIDDFATEFMHTDVVLNHAPNSKSNDYKAADYTHFALGTKYCLLRPKFIEAAKNHRQLTKIEKAFVCFGGADPTKLTLLAVKALLNFDIFLEINVVLGRANQDTEIFNLAKENPQIRIHYNLDEEELVDVMKKCQLAIAPSSTIAFELCAVKSLILSGYYVENQRSIYESLVEKDVVVGCGSIMNYSVNDFILKIRFTLDLENKNRFFENQFRLIDGKSKDRFLMLLNNLE